MLNMQFSGLLNYDVQCRSSILGGFPIDIGGLPFALGVLPDPDLSDEHTDLQNIPDVSFRRFFP
jgi:hypothetical protein